MRSNLRSLTIDEKYKIKISISLSISKIINKLNSKINIFKEYDNINKLCGSVNKKIIKVDNSYNNTSEINKSRYDIEKKNKVKKNKKSKKDKIKKKETNEKDN